MKIARTNQRMDKKGGKGVGLYRRSDAHRIGLLAVRDAIMIPPLLKARLESRTTT